MNKKLTGLLLAGLLLAGVVSCGEGNKPNNTSTGSSELTTEQTTGGGSEQTTEQTTEQQTTEQTTETPARPMSISGHEEGTTYLPGEELTLTAAVTGVETPEIAWASSNEDVATVANGVVTFKNVSADSKVTITATYAEDERSTASVELDVEWTAIDLTRLHGVNVDKSDYRDSGIFVESGGTTDDGVVNGDTILPFNVYGTRWYVEANVSPTAIADHDQWPKFGLMTGNYPTWDKNIAYDPAAGDLHTMFYYIDAMASSAGAWTNLATVFGENGAWNSWGANSFQVAAGDRYAYDEYTKIGLLRDGIDYVLYAQNGENIVAYKHFTWEGVAADQPSYAWLGGFNVGFNAVDFVVKSGDASFSEACTDAHEYTAWETTKEGTCLEEGEHAHHCVYCGHEETESTGLGNHEVETSEVITPSTCTTKGSHGGECIVCHETITQDLPLDADEHTGTYDDETHKWSCCGLIENLELLSEEIVYDRLASGGWNTDRQTLVSNLKGEFDVTVQYHENGTVVDGQWWRGVLPQVMANDGTTSPSVWVIRKDWWGWCDLNGSSANLGTWQNDNETYRNSWWTDATAGEYNSTKYMEIVNDCDISLNVKRENTTITMTFSVTSALYEGETFVYTAKLFDVNPETNVDILLGAEFAKATITSVKINKGYYAA